MKKYYLAYGSNLNVRQMAWRCPTAKAVGTAVIKDYELLFKGSKTGAYLTIEPKSGAEVPVAVWSVEPSDELNLDRYEGYPTFYYKTEIELPVRYFSGKTVGRTAFVYIMHRLSCTLCMKSVHWACRAVRMFGLALRVTAVLVLMRVFFSQR